MSYIDKFTRGYKRFRRNHFVKKSALYKELVKNGQSPKALMIACCDSRVDPGIITNSKPGDIFVVRNVANIVPDHGRKNCNYAFGAALEFAVKVLKVSHVIVMGHSDCGGIKALVDENTADTLPLVTRWVEVVGDAVEQEKASDHDGNIYTRCEQAGVKQSFENLRSYPFVKESEDAGNLELHGWHFDLSTGRVSDFKEESNQFLKLD